jgi:hypothetical protein
MTNNTITTTKSNNYSSIYGNATYIPQIKPFKPDYNFYQNVISQTEISYQQKNQKTDLDYRIEAFVNEYRKPSNIKKRNDYINLIKGYYGTFESFPSSYPDGEYIVTSTVEPQVGWENGLADFSENVHVILKNNKIISIRDTNDQNGGYMYWTEQKDFSYYKEDQIYFCISESNEVRNGIAEVRTHVCGNNNGSWYLSSGNIHKFYFFQYLEAFRSAQLCLSELKSKYANLTVYPKATEGWNIVNVTDGNLFCDVRSVFVSNGKITLWKRADGVEVPILSGGVISNGKSTVTITGSNNQVLTNDVYFDGTIQNSNILSTNVNTQNNVSNDETKNDLIEESCYSQWCKAFEIRGADDVKDGWHKNVVLAIRSGSDTKCYTAKVQVESGKLKEIYIKYVNGKYELYKAEWKSKDIYPPIINGITKTLQTKDDDLVNVIFIYHLSAK